MGQGECAFVTLVTSNSYTIGAQVLAHSLKKVNCCYPLVVLVTPDVSHENRLILSQHYTIVPVETIDSNDAKNLELLGRPELGITFTKLFVWTLTQYSKVVFLDADTLVLQNVDDLMEREEFSACPDAGWPDCFNSGVFVCRPNHDTFTQLMNMATSVGSFDGGDQGLLNQYFKDWARGDSSRRIPFTYNLTFSASYSYLPAYMYHKEDVKIVHFIGQHKPWKFHRFSSDRSVIPHSGISENALELVNKWWEFHDDLLPKKANQRVVHTYYGQDFKHFPKPERFHIQRRATWSTEKERPSIEEFASYRVQWGSKVESSVQRRLSVNAKNSGRDEDDVDYQPVKLKSSPTSSPPKGNSPVISQSKNNSFK
ncbi:Glycosyl transferase, family 8 domain-containing protein [Rozella allomycis CSF55]|uniref:glycogenin glucosyltransferase n=1 Tax=Rozella allomycis (strain CSF55) TaxID=988480 RepID=A0A075API4_ROZAC|nr:Glycosyl transferase, family 8 domain-containing protein [Rozella allomycis CSF55]|eukprot:EPZ32024.1 Glycosyl transferase, family 8 domain-containing protein [Rozella allomycis CSF55]